MEQYKIKGLDLKGIDKQTGEEHKYFGIACIEGLWYGVINARSTERQLLELVCIPTAQKTKHNKVYSKCKHPVASRYKPIMCGVCGEKVHFV
jgi:hypothetical protein